MEQTRKRFAVYHDYYGRLGETYAVSERKAINNVLFATGHLGYDRDDEYISPDECWANEVDIMPPKPVKKAKSTPIVPIKNYEPEYETISLFERSVYGIENNL